MMKYFKLVLPRAETCFFTALEAHDRVGNPVSSGDSAPSVQKPAFSQCLPMLSAYVPRSIDTVILDQKHLFLISFSLGALFQGLQILPYGNLGLYTGIWIRGDTSDHSALGKSISP